MLTIGELAKKAGVRTSALRYYEDEGLLVANGRTDSGYRLYKPEAIQRLYLIQRAQRLGFSLADIRTLLEGYDQGNLSDAALIETAESRYLALDKQVTELLTLQHELQLFLQDLYQQHGTSDHFAAMVERICANPITQPAAKGVLDWLVAYTGCVLSTEAGKAILERLQGLHIHIWQEKDVYFILVVNRDTAVYQSLLELAQLEANCQVHSQTIPELSDNEEGYLLRVTGPNAFIFARLFLALEQSPQS
ncbi:MAG: MerR family transcriptional regulator [Ardenticatenaceae bacterium]|nr:MerR family transcriptional regulator [Ardenticatenaceae bacterium]MCB9445709.1 MerR family transcriptional regulator [Ardenticatenaceae bacterium]